MMPGEVKLFEADDMDDARDRLGGSDHD